MSTLGSMGRRNSVCDTGASKTTPITPSADRLDGRPGRGQQATTSVEGWVGVERKEETMGEG